MSLARGVRLGRYEIRSQIGSGGMGEVYLAWDSELDRTIALKILPPEIASDPERMRRFAHEAKSARRRLAFASTRSGTGEIWIANSDGTNPLKMTSVGGPQCSNPQWSPDGERILFNSRREGTADLYILQPDSGEIHRITHDPSEEVEPRWSRDGQWIYFGSNKTGRYEVWRMRGPGGVPTQITRQRGLMATESPDGSFLYYAKDFRSPTTIWRVPVGGGAETQVVDGLSYSLNFVVADRGLYFVAVAGAPDQTSIDFVDISTSRRTSLVRLGKPWYYGMALSPHKDSLLVSLVDSAGANLMVVHDFR